MVQPWVGRSSRACEEQMPSRSPTNYIGGSDGSRLHLSCSSSRRHVCWVASCSMQVSHRLSPSITVSSLMMFAHVISRVSHSPFTSLKRVRRVSLSDTLGTAAEAVAILVSKGILAEGGRVREGVMCANLSHNESVGRGGLAGDGSQGPGPCQGKESLRSGSRDEASRDLTVVRSMDRAQRRGCSRPVIGMVGSQWRKTQHSAGWMWSPSSHSQASGASSDSGVDLHQLTRIIRLGHWDGLQWWRIRGLRNHPLMEGCCCWAAILCSNRSAARIASNETSNVDLSLWGRLPTGSWRGATGQHTPGYTWFRLGIKFSSSSRVRNSALIPWLTPWTRSLCGLRLCCQGVWYVYTGSGEIQGHVALMNHPPVRGQGTLWPHVLSPMRESG